MIFLGCFLASGFPSLGFGLVHPGFLVAMNSRSEYTCYTTNLLESFPVLPLEISSRNMAGQGCIFWKLMMKSACHHFGYCRISDLCSMSL